MLSPISQRTCAVFGASGFIGRHLVRALLSDGHLVRALVRPGSVGRVAEFRSDPRFHLIEGDLCDEASLARTLTGCDCAFHLAWTTVPARSNLDPLRDLNTNVAGSLRLLQQASAKGIKLIFASSGGTVYGEANELPIAEDHPTHPICAYGVSKLAVEKYIGLFRKLENLEGIVLRIANCYGEGSREESMQGVIPIWMRKIVGHAPIELWGDGSAMRDYVHVADVIDALLRSLEFSGEENIFNIGSGAGMTLMDVIGAIERVTGETALIKTAGARIFDVKSNVLRIERARDALSWAPRTTIDEGLCGIFESMTRKIR